jgi:hypothetical protein
VITKIKRLIYIFFFIFIVSKKNFLNKDLLYYKQFGFGDFVIFCLYLRNKLNQSKKLFCYSRVQYEVASFFFNKKKIFKSKILLPKFLSEAHFGSHFLRNKSYFKPIEIPHKLRLNKEQPLKPNIEINNFINNCISEYNYSADILNFTQYKFITMHIKHFNSDRNSLFTSIRQTAELDKIFEILKYLDRKIKVVLFVNKRDKFYNIFKKKKKNFKNVFFIFDFDEKNYFAAQILLSKFSLGYIGNHGGANILHFFNKKKCIIFNTFYLKDHLAYGSDFLFLYKKIELGKSKKILTEDLFVKIKKNKIKFNLIENSSTEIISAIDKHFYLNC